MSPIAHQVDAKGGHFGRCDSGPCRCELFFSSVLWRRSGHAGEVVFDLRIRIHRVESPGSHEAEQVLLSPAAEHRRRDLGHLQASQGGEDLGLVAGRLSEPGDLTAGEVVPVSVVVDAHSPIGGEVTAGVSGGIAHLVGTERGLRPATQGSLAVGEDVEAPRTRWTGARDSCRGSSTGGGG